MSSTSEKNHYHFSSDQEGIGSGTIPTSDDLLPSSDPPEYQAQPKPKTAQQKYSPSVKLFIRFLPSKRTSFFVLLFSLLHGSIPTYQTFLLGWAFNAFADYNRIQSPTQDDKMRFIKEVVTPSAQLVAIGVANIIFGGLSFWLWNLIGEAGARRNRKMFWDTVVSKEMGWFETGMGSENDGEESVGAAGLMGRFTKETEDVRIATCNTLPLLLAHIATFLSCLLVAFIKGPLLSLVVLSSVPLVFLVFGLAERAATPRMVIDREITLRASGRIERALANISTVKAFNAQAFEISAVEKLLEMSRVNYEVNTRFWGIRIAVTQIILLTMFVQGFWFGIAQVKHGKLDPGEAYQVFWACLLLSGSVQQIAFLLLAWERGKVAAAGLMDLIEPFGSSNEEEIDTTKYRYRSTTMESEFSHKGPVELPLPAITKYRSSPRPRPTYMRRMTPATFFGNGNIELKNVTFYYPSRPKPAPPSLKNASLSFVPKETTFLVGESGSGKSTVAALLVGLYGPTEGEIFVDEQSLTWVDEIWLRSGICLVSQSSGVLYHGTVHDNIAVGVAGSGRNPRSVTRQEVIDAAKGAMVHEFVNELPDGYDTVLSGENGPSLSGGQKQRIAIARAWIRDPNVLILDEATSALDIGLRRVVDESIREWRKNKTTIIITHDVTPIQEGDLVYVLENGSVVQKGLRRNLQGIRGSPFTRIAASCSLPPQSSSIDNLSLHEISADPSQIRTSLSVHRNSSALDKRTSLNLWSIFQRFSKAEDASFTENEAGHKAESNWLKRLSRLSHDEEKGTAEEPSYGFFVAAKMLYKTVPNKILLWTGTFVAICSGALIPIFSSFVGKLLANLAMPSDDILRLSLLTLSVSILAGATEGLKYTLLERTSMRWITSLRKQAYELIIHQENSWFDEESHKASILVQRVIKDGEDARLLIGQVCVQFIIVLAIVVIGVGWALILGWKLSLCGIAIAPIFYGVVQWQARLSSRQEAKKKSSRERLGTDFLELVSNIKSIRSMGLENSFSAKFSDSLSAAYNVATQSAFLCGLANPIGGAIGFFGEGILFVIGAFLIRSGEYDFAKMVEVYSLFMFSLTFSAQMLTYIPTFSRSSLAAMDLAKFLLLKPPTPGNIPSSETFSMRGRIDFRDVCFRYPCRDSVSVLKHVTFTVHPGECVGIVGGSGSGKSTLAALMQRLYTPSAGKILVDGQDIRWMDPTFLRNHIGVVNQQSALFDATVAENIAYGAADIDLGQITQAAIGAHANDFIQSLPKGYNTNLGESASLISGGQAQRISIARALLRPREVLILDECTSALDATNQGLVIETIMAVKQGRTTIIITHSLPVMQMCDYLLVMEKGKLVQVGSYEQLSHIDGPFTKLASQGLFQ